MLSNQTGSLGVISSIKISVWQDTRETLIAQHAKIITFSASAVARVDNLEFLSDVVPRTMTYREYKEKKARTAKAQEFQPLPNGQRTLDNLRLLPRRPAEVADSVKGDDESLTPEDSQETIDDLPPEAHTQSRRTTNGSRHREASNASAQQNDSSAQQDDSGEDVEMIWDD